MKLCCQLEPDDYVRAQYLNLRPRSIMQWFALTAALVAFASSAASICFGPKPPLIAYAIVATFIAILLLFLVWPPSRIRKTFRQQKLLQEPYECVIDENGLSSNSARGSLQLAWKDFHKYRVGKDLILVYQSDAIFHMFAKRWFAGSEYEEFLAILKKELGAPK